MKRPAAGVDVECFENWFLIGITCAVTRQRWDYHMVPGTQLDVASVRALLQHFQMITFNGGHYDEMMVVAALAGWNNAQLKELNDTIIKSGKPDWMIRKDFNLWRPDYIDHIDVMSVIPGIPISLKMNAARLHVQKMQDSPVSFEAPIPFHMIGEETAYCGNDREVTIQLFNVLKQRIALREGITARYGVDVRSKSDAQIAEKAIEAEWIQRMHASILSWENYTPEAQDQYMVALHQRLAVEPGFHSKSFPHLTQRYELDWKGRIRVIKRVIQHGYKFKYEPPSYIEFVTPQLKEIFETVKQQTFFVSDKEQAVQLGADPDEKIKTGVVMPEYLKKLVIPIGNARYKLGIGGLHSQESGVAHKTVPGVWTMRTADVASYYPSLIIKLRLIPDALGPLFAEIYEDFYKERLDAKARAKQLAKIAGLSPEEEALLAELLTTEGGLKIVLNGTFGKLWSKHSIFFAPEHGVHITMTGQLCLLMLIERLHLAGIMVVSANTDGIEMKIPYGLEAVCDMIIKWWEKTTELTMEMEDYAGLYSRDVNNYIRINADGSVKRKGTYRNSGVLENKTPKYDICADAMVEFLKSGTPIRDTVMACRDIRKFVEARKAGNAGYYSTPQNPVIARKVDNNGKTESEYESGGVFLGKAVRWYYGTGRQGCYIANHKGQQVAGTEGCVPCMELPAEFPTDVDIERYVAIAETMLDEVGFGIPF
ncbi:DNA polymerase [Stenotrophomonas phage Silvanus]|nr:DNA polymerase [Stenotrophomonas phage Silvanus]